MADGTEEGKIFVGGLSWETNEDKLRNYFSEFGDVSECLVMKNQETGKSRGFGFVTFLDPSSVKKVLRIPNHQLDGRTIDPKECNPKIAARARKDYKQTNCSKIFLGGLPPNITETNLREFFSKYGKVNEAIIMFDQEKKKSRGFGFLSFDSEDAINKVVAEHYVTINGKQVEVKRAEPQHVKSGTPAPNGNVPHGGPNVPMPYFMTPWGVWPSTMAPMMNGISPAAAAAASAGYSPNVWNPTTAAAAAAAIAATAAASSGPPNWSPYGYPPGWAPGPPAPYGHHQQPGPPHHGHSFGQPGNHVSAAGQSASHSSGGSTGPAGPSNFIPPTNVASINQNVPNGSTTSLSSAMIPSAIGNTGMGNYQHETNNYGGPGPNPTVYRSTYAVLNNTHPGSAAGAAGPGQWNPSGSFGPGGGPSGNAAVAAAAAAAAAAAIQQGSVPPPASQHHQNETMPPNSYNQSLQFHGSRIVSQNQGYHPYRRS